MKVSEVEIEKIVPYDNNPRVISADSIDRVSASIKEFGWQQPIVVDEENVIIVGHTRYFAAKKMKLDKVPVKTMKGATKEQINAYRLIDNKTGELTQWNSKLLDLELDSLELDEIFSEMFQEAEFSDELRAIDFLTEHMEEGKGFADGESNVDNGDFVTLQFTMRPVDRDVVNNSLRQIQRSNGLANTTQALLKLIKEVS